MGWGLGALQRTGPRVVGQGLRTLAPLCSQVGAELRGHPAQGQVSAPTKQGSSSSFPWLFLKCLGPKGVGRSPLGPLGKGGKSKTPHC